VLTLSVVVPITYNWFWSERGATSLPLVFAQATTRTPAAQASPQATAQATTTPRAGTPAATAGTPRAGQATRTATPGPVAGRQLPSVATPGGNLGRNISLELVKVADGLVDPINVVVPPDGSNRLFVVERPGRIRIVENGQVLEEPFLDITNMTLSAFLEQGLYDLAFHPDFANNGRFYVHFAELLRNGDSMIVEYQVSQDDANVADPESAPRSCRLTSPGPTTMAAS
jgi:glucose/arabinose dehydrogenase